MLKIAKKSIKKTTYKVNTTVVSCNQMAAMPVVAPSGECLRVKAGMVYLQGKNCDPYVSASGTG